MFITDMRNTLNVSTKAGLDIPFPAGFSLFYLALCSAVIYLALTGNWKIGLAVLFLCCFLAAAWKDRWNIFLLASICIISVLELSFGIHLGPVPGLSLMNIALGLSIFLMAAGNLRREKRFFQRSIFNAPILILVIYELISLLSTYLKGGYSESLPALLTLLKSEIDPFIIFIIAFNLPRSRNDVKNTIYFLQIFFLVIIFLNVLNYYFGISFFSFANVGWGIKEISSGPYQPGFRLTGLFHDPNRFAGLLILFSALTILSVFYARQFLLKILLAVSTFFLLFSLVLAGSRGGYVAFAVVIVVLFAAAVKKKLIGTRQAVLYGLAFLLFIAAVFTFYRVPFMTNVLGRLQSENYHNIITATSRLESWKAGLAGYLQAPFFGHGWKNFFDVHNSYIYYLVTLGLTGFILYIYIFVNFLLSSWRGIKSRGFDSGNFINLGFLAGLAGYLAVMNFIGIYYVFHYLFLYAGLVMKHNVLKKSPLHGESPFEKRKIHA